MKVKIKHSPTKLLLSGKKARHETYVASRIWDIHEEISRITFNLDRLKVTPKNKEAKAIEIFDEIKNKLWYLRKYQRYYRLLRV